MAPKDSAVDASVDEAARARREFLKSCGKYAAVTPPVVALLLSGTASPTLAVSPGLPGAGAGAGAGAGVGAGGD